MLSDDAKIYHYSFYAERHEDTLMYGDRIYGFTNM